MEIKEVYTDRDRERDNKKLRRDLKRFLKNLNSGNSYERKSSKVF